MKFVGRMFIAKLSILLFLVSGCQTVTEMIRPESERDAATSNAVKETFLKEKAIDLTGITVRTTDGSVDLSGTVPSLEARERAVKLAWQVGGIKSVVNHLEVKK